MNIHVIWVNGRLPPHYVCFSGLRGGSFLQAFYSFQRAFLYPWAFFSKDPSSGHVFFVLFRGKGSRIWVALLVTSAAVFTRLKLERRPFLVMGTGSIFMVSNFNGPGRFLLSSHVCFICVCNIISTFRVFNRFVRHARLPIRDHFRLFLCTVTNVGRGLTFRVF